MNPFLASGLLLIIRFLMFLAANQVMPTRADQYNKLDELLDAAQRYSTQLSNHTLNAHQMDDSNSGKQVM
ncbi:MAG TPA: hypothetical protein VGF75_02595 [Candidatus Saccharimonadales bacterium]|jgi:hypothetical protein